MNRRCLHETRFSTGSHEYILGKRLVFYSACFDGRSRSVSWRVSKSLNPGCDVFLTDPASWVCVLGATIKDKSLGLIGLYAANGHAERPDLFQ